MSEWFLNFSAWEGGIIDVKVISEWFLNFSARERDILNVQMNDKDTYEWNSS